VGSRDRSLFSLFGNLVEPGEMPCHGRWHLQASQYTQIDILHQMTEQKEKYINGSDISQKVIGSLLSFSISLAESNYCDGIVNNLLHLWKLWSQEPKHA